VVSHGSIQPRVKSQIASRKSDISIQRISTLCINQPRGSGGGGGGRGGGREFSEDIGEIAVRSSHRAANGRGAGVGYLVAEVEYGRARVIAASGFESSAPTCPSRDDDGRNGDKSPRDDTLVADRCRFPASPREPNGTGATETEASLSPPRGSSTADPRRGL